MTSGAIRRAKLPVKSSQPKTNTIFFLSPNQQCRSTEGKSCHLINSVKSLKQRRNSRPSRSCNAVVPVDNRTCAAVLQYVFSPKQQHVSFYFLENTAKNPWPGVAENLTVAVDLNIKVATGPTGCSFFARGNLKFHHDTESKQNCCKRKSLTILTAIFNTDLGQPVPECLHSGFIGAKDDEGGGDNWSYKTCKAPNHHQQTDTHFFFITGWMPFLSPNQQCQSTEGKSVVRESLKYKKKFLGKRNVPTHVKPSKAISSYKMQRHDQIAPNKN